MPVECRGLRGVLALGLRVRPEVRSTRSCRVPASRTPAAHLCVCPRFRALLRSASEGPHSRPSCHVWRITHHSRESPVPEGSFAALDYMFHPRSIAVVGASTQDGPGSFVAALKEMGFAGPLYPVNPKADEIQGLKCYPRLTEIPGDVDHVISSVPLRFVEQLVEDCAAKHVKVLHFFTAGFSETGDEEATALERRVLARAAELGIRVVGPNCMGLYVPASGLSFMPFLETEPGPVALLSQSGANAGEFCRTGAARGLRYSKVVSYGNGADVRESELLEYIAEDPETAVVGCYIEGITDGPRFMRALRKAAAAKPVVILKGGRTEAGTRAANSHTGSLAGSLAIFDSAVRQAGAMRVGRMEE